MCSHKSGKVAGVFGSDVHLKYPSLIASTLALCLFPILANAAAADSDIPIISGFYRGLVQEFEGLRIRYTDGRLSIAERKSFARKAVEVLKNIDFNRNLYRRNGGIHEEVSVDLSPEADKAHRKRLEHFLSDTKLLSLANLEIESLEIMADSIPYYVLAQRQAAAAGDAGAQFRLGIMYLRGAGVRKDHAQVVQWWTKAAQQGHTEAQYSLGNMFPVGVWRVHWLTKAAEQGDLWAQYDLGVMFADAIGVPKDFARALLWLTKAAEGGDARAHYRIAMMYHQGTGVVLDVMKALSWYKKAADQGLPEATLKIQELLAVRQYATFQDYELAVRMRLGESTPNGKQLASLRQSGITNDAQFAEVASRMKASRYLQDNQVPLITHLLDFIRDEQNGRALNLTAVAFRARRQAEERAAVARRIAAEKEAQRRSEALARAVKEREAEELRRRCSTESGRMDMIVDEVIKHTSSPAESVRYVKAAATLAPNLADARQRENFETLLKNFETLLKIVELYRRKVRLVFNPKWIDLEYLVFEKRLERHTPGSLEWSIVFNSLTEGGQDVWLDSLATLKRACSVRK